MGQDLFFRMMYQYKMIEILSNPLKVSNERSLVFAWIFGDVTGGKFELGVDVTEKELSDGNDSYKPNLPLIKIYTLYV